MKNKVNRHEQAAPSEDSTGSPQADALRPSSVQAGQALRKKDEEIARGKTAQSPENLEAMSPEEVRQTLHELQVHQIELEMQNEELRRAQEELEAARARYFDLFDQAPIGYFTVSEAGLIMEVNLTAANMLGVTRGSLVKQPLTRFILSEDRDIYYRRRKLLFETGAPQMCEMRMVKKDAAPFWAQMEARLAQNAEGAPVCRAVVSDISARNRVEVELQQVRDELEHRVTERTVALRRANEERRTDIINRKRVEEIMRRTEENFRRSLDDSPLGVRIVTIEGETIYANRTILDIYGYDSVEELRTTPIKNRYTPQSNAEFKIRREKRKKGDDDGPSEYDISIVRKNGEIRYLQVFRKDVLWDGERQFQVIYQDITERKRAEEELCESETRYRLLAENATDVIWTVGMDMRLTYVSPSVTRLLGFTVEEAMARTMQQVYTPVAFEKAMQIFAEEMTIESAGHGDPTRSRMLELELVRKDGNTVPVEGNFCFLRDPTGKAIGMLSIVRDITERKRVEKKLQNTLDSLRKAFGTTIQVMISAIEVRDPYTAGHQLRSTDLARAIATEMGLPQEKIDGIRMAGSIHDIGKLSVPAEILSKPTKLTNIEFSLIKEHSQKGYEMLKDVESPWPLAEIVYQHHERMDGSGYPRNLKGDDILMEARIMAVADVVEAMASHRPYRAGLGIDVALAEIEKNKGILYDSTAADACLRLFREKGFKLEGT